MSNLMRPNLRRMRRPMHAATSSAEIDPTPGGSSSARTGAHLVNGGSLVHRLIAASLAFFALTATILIVPVYASPTPAAEPVEASVDEVEMGSVDDPAPAAEVQTGTTESVPGVA